MPQETKPKYAVNAVNVCWITSFIVKITLPVNSFGSPPEVRKQEKTTYAWDVLKDSFF